MIDVILIGSGITLMLLFILLIGAIAWSEFEDTELGQAIVDKLVDKINK